MLKDKTILKFGGRLKKAIIILSAFILVPELLLQAASFWFWYDDHTDNAPVVLCIADYQASYPAKLQKKVSDSGMKWKVVSEMNEGLTIQQASSIIQSYFKQKKPSLIYLTLGKADMLRDISNRSPNEFIWSDAYEWKLRSPLLFSWMTGALSGWQAIFNSNHFQKIENDNLKVRSGNKMKSKKGRMTAKKNGSGGKNASHVADPTAFHDFPLEILASKPLPPQPSEFPVGHWASPELSLDVLPENKVLFGPDTLFWRSVGNTVEIHGNEHSMFFFWQMDGDQLILYPRRYAMAFSLKRAPIQKVGPALKSLQETFSAWKSLYSGDLDKAEQFFNQAMRSNPQDPEPPAALSRIYLRSGRNDAARSASEKVKKLYQMRGDQRAAEALLLVMVDSDCHEISNAATELIERFPHSALLWTILGRYSMQCGDKKLADASNQRAQNLFPANAFQDLMRPKGGNRSPARRLVANSKLDQIQKKIEQLIFRTQKNIPVVLVASDELSSDQNRMLAKVARRTQTMLLGFPKESDMVNLKDVSPQEFLAGQVVSNFEELLRNQKRAE